VNGSFKKNRRNLFTGGKFGRYLPYALGEILLVVIGILIALQVDNWNDQRIERKEELKILEQLVEDFNTNKVILGNFEEDYARVLNNIEAALQNTGPRATLPSVSVFESIDNLWTPTIELLHTDASAEYGLSIERLSNSRLKLAVLSFPATFIQYKELENTLKNLTLQQRRIHQRYIPLIASEPEYTQEMFPSDSVGFLRDREFQNTSVDRLWNTRNARLRLEWLAKHNDTILKLLNTELDYLRND
jgi:hypothetical protein